MKKLLLLLIIIISLSVKANDNVTIHWRNGSITEYRAKYFWTDFNYIYDYLAYDGYKEEGDKGDGKYSYVCFYDYSTSKDCDDWIQDYKDLDKIIENKGKFHHLVINRNDTYSWWSLGLKMSEVKWIVVH